MKKSSPRAENLRRALAQEAARVMAEHGVRDYRFAKRKAAERFGVIDEAVLPRNTEIEAALLEYQRLFAAESHEATLEAQRRVALDVMQRLAAFSPRLVGPVLLGTATEHDDVVLHVFVDRLETLTWRLMEHGVPHDVGEKRIKFNADRILQLPVLRLEVDEQAVELVVFGIDGIRQAPVSPVDGKPMRRADAAEVAALIDSG
jgi:hypothetical protein